MDEASRLVSELHNKLAELDLRVWQYRRDMASEFTKYTEDLLRDVPKEISETVSKVIAEDIKCYKSLNLDSLTPIESCGANTDNLVNGLQNAVPPYLTNSTSSFLYRAQDPELEAPRSPHERDKEFHGLFTPSYLPLLDSITREHKSDHDSSLDKGKEREMESVQVDASTDTRSLTSTPELRRPAAPKRRSTDEVSVTSDNSDGLIRRSALRRSSSSSKTQSPRRVRFEVMGEEVLPTASPQPNESILSDDIPPSARIIGDDSEDRAGSEEIEDIDEPPPKRISSSQALRALSRGPLEDDGTQWTTVSAGPDGEPFDAGISQNSSTEEDLRISPSKPQTTWDSQDRLYIPEASAPSDPTVHRSRLETLDERNGAETPSDDEMLDMPPLKPMRGQRSSSASILPSVEDPGLNDYEFPTAAEKASSTPWFSLKTFVNDQNRGGGEDLAFTEDDHDELFHFDENSNEQRLPPEEHNDSEPDSPISPEREKELPDLSKYSRSPAREIPTRIVPQFTSVSKGVVGSYKGHPFSMPIVSDEIHAQAASLGAINSFVGSLDGRSGLDESDIQSFRESFKASGGAGSFNGAAPKSMTERMMMEDLLEGEEAKRP
jgi:hypothetical protein